MSTSVTTLKSKLAVLESKWDDRKNSSVKGLFDVMADLCYKNQHAYSYNQFHDSASFKDLIARFGRDPAIRFVYIAAHGTKNALQARSGELVSKTQIKNSLADLPARVLDGLFFGSCSFANEEVAASLLESYAVGWVAGYAKQVDWINSSVLDLLFWNTLDQKKGTPIKRIRAVAKKLRASVPGLIRELGFCLYIRKQGSGGIQDLLGEDE